MICIYQIFGLTILFIYMQLCIIFHTGVNIVVHIWITGGIMRKIQVFPDNDKTIGWAALTPAREATKALTKTITADYLVIGAGLSGLAAARRLAENEPNKHVVLLDAEQIGDGSHARNSGFAIDVPHNTNSTMIEIEDAQRHVRLARAAISYLTTQVKKHNLACDWEEIGKFHAAVSQKGIDTILVPTKKILESINEPYEWLEGKALHDRVGFSHFAAGIYTPGTILLNPRALSQGLANSLPSNVTIYENSPVINISYSPQVEAETTQGKVIAKKMILSVNAFAEKFGFFKNRLIPVSAHASLTRVLTEAEQKQLVGLRSWGITPANSFVGITMRRTPDQRILIRQKMRYIPNLRTDGLAVQDVISEHQQLFDERFPMLKGVTIEHCWKGVMCLSANKSPGFGKVAPNVFSAVCHNGVGLTYGTIAGLLSADMLGNVDNPLIEDMEALGKPNSLPPRPFLDAGVQTRFQWELWRNRAEA